MGPTSGTPAAVVAAPAVTFDCFGTLVDTSRPEAPWTAVASTLAERGIAVPEDWEAAYRTSHADLDRLEDQPLGEHVRAALASCGIECSTEAARDAVFEAFDRPARPRRGAGPVLDALDVPVGVVSNCSVPGLVRRSLDRAELDGDIDAIVTSVDCGRLKPHPRPFETVSEALDVDLANLVHVGDDAAADGGAERAGATTVLLEHHTLEAILATLEGRACR